MGYKRISIIVSALLLGLLSACQMTGVTPAPQPPGAGQIQNNPIEQNQYMSQENSSLLKTAVPATIPAQVNCNQTGCPYPAVCDKTSGVCTINQSQGPGAAAPQAPGAGIIANSVSNGGIPPHETACVPPIPTISKVNSFCDNQAAHLGGVTWDEQPAPGDPSYVLSGVTSASYPGANGLCGAYNNQNDPNQAFCSGPQGATLNLDFCTSCGAPPNLRASTVEAWAANNGVPWQCVNGYAPDPTTGYCAPANPNADYHVCPAGSHYDNAAQNCADNVTNATSGVGPCPVGYPYYLPDVRLCLAKPYPVVYNCQTFTIPLGVCLVPHVVPHVIKKSQCPAGQTYQCKTNSDGKLICSCK